MNHYPFTLLNLNYDFDDLEPIINHQVLEIHYYHHYQKYLDQLNKLLLGLPNFQQWSLAEILTNPGLLPPQCRLSIESNSGGVYTHQLYFSSLTRPQKQLPDNPIIKQINRTFGSFEDFKTTIVKLGSSLIGSGWIWLIIDDFHNLKVITTSNQQVPFLGLYTPLLVIDLWEHAYYLQYQWQRSLYLDQIFTIIDWQVINKRYLDFINNRHNYKY